MAHILITRIVDGRLGPTERYDCKDLAEANELMDSIEHGYSEFDFVGCVKLGDKIKRVV